MSSIGVSVGRELIPGSARSHSVKLAAEPSSVGSSPPVSCYPAHWLRA